MKLLNYIFYLTLITRNNIFAISNSVSRFLAKHIIYTNEILNWNIINVRENIYRMKDHDNEEEYQNEELFVKCKVKRKYKTSLDGGKFQPRHSSVVQITKSMIFFTLFELKKHKMFF